MFAKIYSIRGGKSICTQVKEVSVSKLYSSTVKVRVKIKSSKSRK